MSNKNADDAKAAECVAAARITRKPANRLTAAQYDKLAAWMRAQTLTEEDRISFARETPRDLSEMANNELTFEVTATNCSFVRESVLGIRRAPKIKPAAENQEPDYVATLRVRVANAESNLKDNNAELVRWRVRVVNAESALLQHRAELDQLRMDVRMLAKAYLGYEHGIDREITIGEVRAIAERTK